MPERVKVTRKAGVVIIWIMANKYDDDDGLALFYGYANIFTECGHLNVIICFYYSSNDIFLNRIVGRTTRNILRSIISK